MLQYEKTILLLQHNCNRMTLHTFKDWYSCITEKCGIQLTPAYVQQRLKVLEDNSHPETLKFKELYGDQYLYMVISWFKEAANLIKTQ